MEANKILLKLKEVADIETKLSNLKIINEYEGGGIFNIQLLANEGTKIELDPSPEFSKKLLEFFIKNLSEDYARKLEGLKNQGIKITNFFEKEELENKIKNYKKELDDLWGRGLFTRGQEVQEYIEELENKLKEL